MYCEMTILHINTEVLHIVHSSIVSLTFIGKEEKLENIEEIMIN